MRQNRAGRLLDIGKIRLAPLVERGRHANDDGVYISELREFRGGAEMPAVHKLLDLRLWDVLDVRLARIQLGHLPGIRVKTGDFVTRLRKT